jgi:hypothetical protein
MRDRFPDLRNDRIAVERAVQKGVTSKPDYGQGNGLAGTLAIAHEANGLFSLISAGGSLRTENQNVQLRDFTPPLIGTLAELRLPIDRPVDLPKALWGHTPADYIEVHYEGELGVLDVVMSQIAPTFGNRPTGEKVRNFLANLLAANGKAALKIDFTGIEIIASSFADEAFAKLLIEMGPLDYGARVSFSGMNGTIKGIINKAILERIQQSG